MFNVNVNSASLKYVHLQSAAHSFRMKVRPLKNTFEIY